MSVFGLYRYQLSGSRFQVAGLRSQVFGLGVVGSHPEASNAIVGLARAFGDSADPRPNQLPIHSPFGGRLTWERELC